MWQGIDQRRFPRVQYRCVVKVTQPGGVKEISSVTENVGLGGVCLFLEKESDIFSPVELEIFLEPGIPPIKVQGTVVWVVRRREFRKGASFDTGIEFSNLSPVDRNRLESVLDKLTQKRSA